LKRSEFFLPTLKEVPAEAEVVSHRLMLRAGLIRKVAAGIYTFLPLGFKVLKKIENIVREEMDKAGAQELLMPALQPAELWQESGRWFAYGAEMWRLKDRNERDFCLGPTHEELITEIVRKSIRSYKDLPLNLYQIQFKYRDEPRPRFGILRAREFLMKDAYSFDRDEKGLEESYRKMYQAYQRIFDRLGLRYYIVEAATGLIGGRYSHEFIAEAEAGEDLIYTCDRCEYGANAELATSQADYFSNEEERPYREVSTPGLTSVEEVSNFLNTEPRKLVKTMVYLLDDRPIAVLVPGDREVNESKLASYLGSDRFELLSDEGFEKYGLVKGFVGPVGLKVDKVLADSRVRGMRNFVVGANKPDTHLVDVNLRDFKVDAFEDVTFPLEGETCPRCLKGKLKLTRGIELGHVFQLGTRYSEAMKAYFNDVDGNLKPYQMGCYGIGVSRLLSAIIEQNYDEKGIIWPWSITPFEAHLILVFPEKEDLKGKAEKFYQDLKGKGFEVLLDDRLEVSPGEKFAEADLLGAPLQVIFGKKAFQGEVEIKIRRTGERKDLPLEEGLTFVKNIIKEVREGKEA
jgi:prolyl-tRNA synthetase